MMYTQFAVWMKPIFQYKRSVHLYAHNSYLEKAEREREQEQGRKGAVVHVLHFKIKWRIDYLSFEWNILVSSILLPTMMWKEWKIMLSILNNVLLKTKLGREEVKKRGREKWIEERSEASSGGYLLPRSQISLAPFPFAIP